MNEEKEARIRVPVVNLESVAGVKIPSSAMKKIVHVANALSDVESKYVWKVAVQRMGEVVRVMPQVPKECPKCGATTPKFAKDVRKKCVVVRCHRCGHVVEGPNAVEAAFEWNEQA